RPRGAGGGRTPGGRGGPRGAPGRVAGDLLPGVRPCPRGDRPLEGRPERAGLDGPRNGVRRGAPGMGGPPSPGGRGLVPNATGGPRRAGRPDLPVSGSAGRSTGGGSGPGRRGRGRRGGPGMAHGG